MINPDTFWPKALLLSALAVLAPIHAVMITVCVLIAADFVTGILAARKRGERISSAAMGRTITKMAVYQVAVVSAFLVERFMIAELIPAAKLVAGVIGLVELKSVLENIQVILGAKLFRSVISKLSSKNDQRPAA